MNSKILQVFYDDKCYPFKDQERQVRFPIVGNSFVGASNITTIRFYIDQIGSIDDTWVANSKLPNGKMGNEVLSTKGSDIINGVEEHYVELSLSTFYTQAKGDLYISLNGFYGGVSITENDGIYSISGIPTIQATGSIKISIYYATPLLDGDEVDVITLQQLLGVISSKLGKDENQYLKVVSNINQINTDTYQAYLSSGSVVYSIANKKFYLLSGTYPSLVATEINLSLGSLSIGVLNVGTMHIDNFADILNEEETPLTDYIDERVNYGLTLVFNMTSSPMTLTQAQWDLLVNNPNMNIYYNYRFYKKASKGMVVDTTGIYICPRVDTTTNDGYTTRTTYAISLDIVNYVGTLNAGTQSYSFYNKTQADGLLDLKADKSDTYTKDEVNNLITSMLVYKGSKTVEELNEIAEELDENDVGFFYNVSDSGLLEWTSGGTTYQLEVIAGDNVCWTGSGWDKLTMDLSVYDDKFIAAGFFEVQNYNENTGEITFVYSSDLYDMSYDSDTGILTIDAN